MFTKIFQAVRRMLYSMGIISGTKSAFKDKDIPDYENYYSEFIEKWKQIYKGNPEWRKTKKTGLKPKGERTRDTLNTAKVLCNELATLTFSEQVDITVSDKTYNDYVKKVLQNNGFWKNFPDLLELGYAIGGCVLKTYLEDSKVKIDFVDGDMFIPTSWDNRRIHNGIFVSKTVKGKKFYTLFEWQSKSKRIDESGNEVDCITIENRLFVSSSKDEVGIEVPLSELYPTLEGMIYLNNVNESLFSYLRPAIANNIDTDSPLGISVYANAQDTLKALDIAFDSFNREFILGRKRIIVPVSAIKVLTEQETGNKVRYFDADDEVYQAMKVEDNENLKITDNTMVLRVDDHIKSINALLNILCFQCGLSAGSFSFDAANGFKTATEVISQNSKTYRTKQSHQNLTAEAIEDMVKSIITLGIAIGDLNLIKGDYEVKVEFDDSIIEDKSAERAQDRQDVAMGAMNMWEYRKKWYAEDDETAKANLPQQADLIPDDTTVK